MKINLEAEVLSYSEATARFPERFDFEEVDRDRDEYANGFFETSWTDSYEYVDFIYDRYFAIEANGELVIFVGGHGEKLEELKELFS